MTNFFGALATTAPGRNSREVADAIFEIAQRPAGTRPLRTPVGEPVVVAINAAVVPIQRQMLENFGLDELLPKLPAEALRRRDQHQSQLLGFHNLSGWRSNLWNE